MFSGKLNPHDDTLQALNNENIRDTFKVELDELIREMSTINPKIRLVKELKKNTTKLNKMFNARVDTNDKVKETISSGTGLDRHKTIEVYTTRHWISGCIIQKKWASYKERVKQQAEIRSKRQSSQALIQVNALDQIRSQHTDSRSQYRSGTFKLPMIQQYNENRD